MLGVKPILGRHFRAGRGHAAGREGRDPVVHDVARPVRVRREHRRPRDPRERRADDGRRRDAGTFRVSAERQDLAAAADGSATRRSAPTARSTQVVGKLKPGASLDQANVELATIAKRLAAAYPEADEGFTTTARAFVDSYIGKQPRQLLYTMLGAVFFVLLIACANVANLLLDRAAHRTKEVGVRTALGASRGAVVRQFLAESLVLSLAATVLGIVVAYFGVNAFNRAIAVTQVPFFIDIRLHPQVLLFTIAVAGAHDARRRRDSGVSVVARRHQRDSQGRLARRVELPHRPHHQRRS